MDEILKIILGLVAIALIIFSFYAGYKIGVSLFGYILSILVYIFPKWRDGLHNIVSITLFVSALLIMSIGSGNAGSVFFLLLFFGIGMFIAFIFTLPERWFEWADALFVNIVSKGDKK